jgi:hypothetical protein
MHDDGLNFFPLHRTSSIRVKKLKPLPFGTAFMGLPSAIPLGIPSKRKGLSRLRVMTALISSRFIEQVLSALKN